MSRDAFRHDASGPPAPAGWDEVRAPGVPHGCFADEVAIDFPSVGRVVDRMRDAFLGDESDGAAMLSTELRLSSREAWRGAVVPLAVPVRGVCARCGGRGETWPEPCACCGGTGAAIVHHAVQLAVPARVPDGTRLRFRLSSPHAAPVRVEVRVAIESAA